MKQGSEHGMQYRETSRDIIRLTFIATLALLSIA